MTTHEIDQKLENTQPWANRLHVCLLLSYYRVWKERLPSETWLLAKHSSSLLECARQMLSEVILEIFFWSEWNSVDTNLMNFLKTTPLSLFTLGTTLPGTPSPKAHPSLRAHLSPYFSLHPALCQGRCPPLCSREWAILVFSGSTCVPLSFHGAASVPWVLSSRLRDELWGPSLLMERGPPACGDRVLWSFLLGQLWLWLKRYAELTSTQWHRSLKNVLRHSPCGMCLLMDFAFS